jgi:hypothetical protein
MVFFMAALVALACACGSSKSSDGAGSDKSTSGAVPAKGGALLEGKLKIEGRQVFSIKPKDDGAKLVDDADKELARYKSEKSGFRIKGPDDAALAEIEVKGDEIRVVRGGATVYELKRHPDGDWKLKDGAKAELFHVKKKDGAAFEVEDAKGARVAKVDVNAAGKTKVKDAAGAEVWVAKERVGAAALACLAFDGVDLPIRVGLLLAVDRF